MSNPYDCSVCDAEDCRGCGEEAYEAGMMAVAARLVQFIITGNPTANELRIVDALTSLRRGRLPKEVKDKREAI